MQTCLKCGQQTALDLDDPAAACTVCGAIHSRVVRALADKRRQDDEASARRARRERMVQPAKVAARSIAGAIARLRRWLRPTAQAERVVKAGLVATMLASIAGVAHLMTRRPKRERVNPSRRGRPNPYSKQTGVDDPRFLD